jgi:NADH-ubiquinone oxidoreductase chain 5
VSHPLNDSSWVIIFGISGLLVITIFGGCLLRWLIFPTPELIFLPALIKLITLIVCIRGGLVGYILSVWSLYLKSKIVSFQLQSRFVGSIWFLPVLSTVHVIYPPLNLGKKYIKSIDIGWSEITGGQNLYKIFILISVYLQILHKNNLKLFMILFVLWIMVFLIILFYLNSLH